MFDHSQIRIPAMSFLFFVGASGCSASAQVQEKPFVDLAQAYASRDAEAAAANYSQEAVVIYDYEGASTETFEGREAIERSFGSFFHRIDELLPLDLNFRIAERNGANAHGYYRLRFGKLETSYGRFDVEQSANGLFLRDRSSDATRADFEEAPGSLLVRPDENDLDRDYYGLLAGRYRLPDDCDLVVTRSFVRLFVRNSCDQSWRGLQRVTGLEWTGGNNVLPNGNAERTFRFDAVTDRPSQTLTISRDGTEQTASRVNAYSMRNISFASADGTELAGSIYLPSNRREPAPAIVLVHGSGPQDRDGYASIIAVLADALASNGRIVLAFDKRGSGLSDGNGDGASFDILAADAIAAMKYLGGRDEVLPDAVGLAGSSQAGWVIAKAIEMGATPSDVFLLGAAGTAFSVREQNIYNTDVRMACAGISKAARQIALEQQGAFFDALSDASLAPKLDALTRSASENDEIRDWLFPASGGLQTENAWFTVLDPQFDPLPIWRNFSGRLHFVFSEFDDSTDTSAAIQRLGDVNAVVEVIPGAQHIGLEAQSICGGGLAERSRFSPKLFETIRDFADIATIK